LIDKIRVIRNEIIDDIYGYKQSES